MFRRLLGKLLHEAKGTSAYPVPPELTERLARQVIAQAIPKAVRGLWWRWRLGSCAGVPLIGRGVRISNPQLIHCGRAFVVEDHAEVQGLARDGIRFGDNVTIGRGAQIRPSGYYGRNVGVGLRVGDDSNIGPLAFIGTSGGITLGRRVLMGPGVIILSEEHNFADPHIAIKDQGVRLVPTIVEDDVWLGAGAVIIGGSRVGHGSIVAAGAVVREEVPPDSIVAGVPGRVIGRRPGSNPVE